MKRAAEVIEHQKGEIMRRWKNDVKGNVKGAEFSNDMVLLDHLPDLLNSFIKALNLPKTSPQMLANDNSELFRLSMEHGRHRSASYGYTIDQVIHEFIIFQRVITDVLISEEAFTQEVNQVIKYGIETSMMYSAAAFNKSINEMRQKLIRILAHDLRNPVSSAMLGIELMESGGETERFEKIKGLASNSLKRALDLLEDLLESMSIEAGEGMTVNFSELDLMDYLHSVHFEASEIYTNEIQLETKGVESIKGIFDGAMIRRVLENFISNAVKYGDNDTPVKIIVEDSDEIVTIKVHNLGDPIPEEKKEEIFQYLKTSGNRDGGKRLKSWGIGLALVKAVIEAHDGKLSLDSNRENGTTFGVELPKNKNRPGQIRAQVNFS
ncbi:HAMP domain-containing histidine kinase [Antarcticibacterium sp. 1MA-6-2]|uniref:sensor histidine kinase n=1 Tax=Antarcticibacterium sp. 1MA-6-2 TaxID=2908210 RepID=UPI001F42DC03|nr:HAMP domain-containing sensor histidine kinase [Antarcticibacterium sp. 1MA-6-2]UJH92310.1 HAMP domain-containing histidine kinase [Antarcticibacterium sp. 1MA-6-2]